MPAYAAHVPVTVRDANPGDLPAIVDLLNAAVGTTTVYSERGYTVDDRRTWLDARRGRGFPVLVAEREGAFAGFATYGDFRDSLALPGYRTTVEHSVYVDPVHGRAGVGATLVDALVDRAREAGIHVMVGAIDAENEVSIRFHERLGFVEVGRLPEIATKWDRWLTLVLMQRVLD